MSKKDPDISISHVASSKCFSHYTRQTKASANISAAIKSIARRF